MTGLSIFLSCVIIVICILVFGWKYINAWLAKRKRLSKLNKNLNSLLKRKEDLISLSSWASDSGDNKEAQMILADLKQVEQDISNVQSIISSVKELSILHPGYTSL